jgi:hypothetical protein
MRKEARAMKNGKGEITVFIRRVKEGCYLAYFHSEVLQATYSLYFKDTITGAIALNNFVEMLRIKHDFSTCKLQIDHSISCENKAVLDVIDLYKEEQIPA